MLFPDSLGATPPRGKAFVGIQPLGLAIHQSLAVSRNDGLECLCNPKRKDALAKQNRANELRFDDSVERRQILPRFLVIGALQLSNGDLTDGHTERPGVLACYEEEKPWNNCCALSEAVGP